MMTGPDLSTVSRDVVTLFGAGSVGGLTDAELLERFCARRDAVAEAAFSALVDRHGPMVWGVCRRALTDPNDAADAFQATFLILVRKASTVRVDDSLGRWLYGVSRRVSKRAREISARRSAREAQGVERVVDPAPDAGRAERLNLLDEEIERLPERYRAAVVLCELGGLSHEEAARRLGCAVGTVGSRLSRARDRLRSRLVRRGLAPSAGLALGATAESSTMPVGLTEATVGLVAFDKSVSTSTMGMVSTSIITLTEGVLMSMIVAKLKWVAVALLATGLVSGGALVYALPLSEGQAAGAQQGGGRETPSPPATNPAGPRNTTQAAALSERLSDEVDLLKLELEGKKAELRREQARAEAAEAVVATSRRLNERKPGMVSREEISKAEAEVKIAHAQVEIVEFEVRTIELRLKQASRFRDESPERLKEFLDRVAGSGNVTTLERRFRELERKLETILTKLEEPKAAAPRPGPPQ